MNENDDNALNDAHLDTLAIRAGIRRTAEGEHAEPIFATSSYVFDNAAQAAARFAGEDHGNVYSRYTNPTVRTFEQRIAALVPPGARKRPGRRKLLPVDLFPGRTENTAGEPVYQQGVQTLDELVGVLRIDNEGQIQVRG